jgi:hypothetical protein
VMVAAFCGDELLIRFRCEIDVDAMEKFVIAKCDYQHSERVRSPIRLALPGLPGSLLGPNSLFEAARRSSAKAPTTSRKDLPASVPEPDLRLINFFNEKLLTRFAVPN